MQETSWYGGCARAVAASTSAPSAAAAPCLRGLPAARASAPHAPEPRARPAGPPIARARQVMRDGSIGLIDFGQVKQISGRAREALAKVIVALADRKSDTDPAELELIGKLALELGVKLRPDAKPEGPAATAMWLFDGSVTELPGGYDMGELSPNSPVKEVRGRASSAPRPGAPCAVPGGPLRGCRSRAHLEYCSSRMRPRLSPPQLKSFPQDLVLVGRATVLIKVGATRRARATPCPSLPSSGLLPLDPSGT